MSKEAKILCHLLQDCGACQVYKIAFDKHAKNCEHRKPKNNKINICLRSDNPGPHCCGANCPTFDRDKILKDEQ